MEANNNIEELNNLIEQGRSFMNGEHGEENASRCYEYFQEAENKGFRSGKLYQHLGWCFESGLGVQKDLDKAIHYYELVLSLEADDEYALWQLAGIYYQQKNVKCMDYYSRLAENGNGDAYFQIASIYADGDIIANNSEKELENLRKAIDLGCSNAMYIMAKKIKSGSCPITDNNQRIELLKKAADLEHPMAMCDLACLYHSGEGVEKNLNKAVELMRKAAELGYPNAANNMAYICKNGDAGSIDLNEAIRFAKKAAEGGESDSAFAFAVDLYNGNDPFPEDKKKAVELFEYAANSGSVTAMENLGVCFRYGYGVDIDIATSIVWYEKAALRGSIDALDILKKLCDGKRYVDILYRVAEEDYCGAMVRLYDELLSGENTEKNTLKAVEYLEKAAEAEYPDACFRMGILFYNGDYVDKDLKKAIDYWKIASLKGHSASSKNLGLCYKTGEGVPKDTKTAIAYFETARKQGSIDAILQLGLAYDDNGIGELDYKKAVEYYTEAYSYKSATGAYFLGTMFEDGHGVEQDYIKAIELYNYAAAADDADANIKLGIFYADGVHVNKNLAKAIEYVERAKQLGNKRADTVLAKIYANNVDSNEIDPRKAFSFNLERAKAGDQDAQFQVYKAYDEGRGIAKNGDEAQKWLKVAADNGHVVACGLMGLRSYIIEGPAVAVKYWEVASQGGNLKAMTDLADIYLDGADGVPQNIDRAIYLLRQASNAGFSEAQVSLGICYANGTGVPQNWVEAKRLFELARG